MEKLQEHYPDKVDIKFDYNPLGVDEKNMPKWLPDFKYENMKWADVVMVNNISNFGGPYTARIVGKAKEFGKFVCFDTDDLLTELYEEHRLIEVYRDKGLSDMTKFIYYHSDLVTVTQVKFANRIKEYCNGILAVVKNAIDYNLPCWNAPRHQNKVIRIGWAGGIHHDPDVKEFASVPSIVNQLVGREKIWWDFYGHPPPNTEKDWQWDVWKGYKNTLLRGFKGPGNWTIHYAMAPSMYGVMYANMDIAIAPLKMNAFNDSKSDIKIAEAGRYKVPLIASDVGCYNETIVNGENGYLLKPGATKIEWARTLAKVIKSPKHRKAMGNKLHAITEDYFDINKVIGKRLEIYEAAFKKLGDPRDND